MKNLTQRLDPLKSLFLAFSPLLLLLVFALVMPLFRESFRSCTLSLFQPVKEPAAVKKVPVAERPSGAPMITPISLVDEAFKGYDRIRAASFAKKEEVREKIVQEEKPPETVIVKAIQPVTTPDEILTAVKAPAPETIANTMKSRAKALAANSVHEPAVAPPVVHQISSGGKPGDAKGRYLALVGERATAAGFPEDKKIKMIRSFEELSNIMSAEDAWKVVRMRIGDRAAW